ncbi:hypothetical protein NA56DRAFT_708233 [Hyaloscypha hepaticicola]|uniref:Uncharacterized protein n=1 Tax=Hyaloscypha hepaticicola TaxID=2082293 RepID=A0A2J6PSK9_9HELO|nr:hypothetical protein NA56DRAFT_708233 [Hyaloscypha hepaticicola]
MVGSNLESAGPVDDGDDYDEDIPKTEEELREDASEAALYLVGLFEKYLPIVGALSSGEYRKLLDGIDLVPSPFEPVEAGGMCRACQNLNLRRESFQVGSSRFVSFAMGDLSPDSEYSDKELEKKVPYNLTTGDVYYYKLGDLVDIAKWPKCSICRLITDCFQRLLAEELSSYSYRSELDEWFYGGVVWLGLLYDPVGDHQKNGYFKRQDDNLSILESMEPSDRMRLILTILPRDKKPENTDFSVTYTFFTHRDLCGYR